MSISQICVLLVACSIIKKSLPILMIPCQQQTNCQDCIRLHQNCTWCYEKEYSLPRCNFKYKQKSCDAKTLLQSQDEKPMKISNKLFSNIDEAGLNAVQLRPQKVFVSLRKGIRTTVEFQYQAAKDYPLDLYYLTDLTWSMRDDLGSKKLGHKISQALFDLTKFHKIALGSYVDKPEMPFYLMDNACYENSCEYLNKKYEKGYLFKHKLNFTKDISEFISKVKESKVNNTGNLEGGFDALMQILLCKDQLGWMSNSRKIIVLVTDSMMHLAGDGLLLGATRRNRKKCLIDSRGNYLQPIAFDYPSLEEIHAELKSKKINLIIASKTNSLQYYELLGKLVEESSYVGELSQSSENIIDLVKTGYYKFMKKVSFFVNTTSVNEIEVLNVDIFADCYNTNSYINTSSCENVVEGKAINFKVDFLLSEYPKTDSFTLYIEEKNIPEKIQIDIKFKGSICKICKIKSNKTCKNGKEVCDSCQCNNGWKGELCDEMCTKNVSTCRLEDNGFTSSTCFGKGNCNCGQCICNLPFSGKYCQYTCPGFDTETNTVCSGHGECFDGKCNCIGSFNGTDCGCSLDDDDCKTPGVNTCNSHGTCTCNSCRCDDGYSGAYCEICKQCDEFCNTYGPCLKRALDAKNDICQLSNHHRNSTTPVPVQENTILSENSLPTDCTDVYINDDGVTLELLFRYIIKDRNVHIEYQLNNATSFDASTITALIALITVLGLGLCAIGLLKLRIHMREKAEYKRFRTEALNATNKTNNEIYNSPMRNYEVPMQVFNNHSKRE